MAPTADFQLVAKSFFSIKGEVDNRLKAAWEKTAKISPSLSSYENEILVNEFRFYRFFRISIYRLKSLLSRNIRGLK